MLVKNSLTLIRSEESGAQERKMAEKKRKGNMVYVSRESCSGAIPERQNLLEILIDISTQQMSM